MAVIFQSFCNLFHDISLRAQKFIHLLKAQLFSFNFELPAKRVELLQVKLHDANVLYLVTRDVWVFPKLGLIYSTVRSGTLVAMSAFVRV